MAKANPTPIPPFPATIDRSLFGAWLSGLTSGEGHFGLRLNKNRRPGKTYRVPAALYGINLRADDMPALRLVQAFLACGILKYARILKTRPRSCPQVFFTVSRFHDLRDKVIPQFEHHPLWAKKAGDYVVWKEGVRILCAVHDRSWHGNGSPRTGTRGGFSPKWLPAEREHFADLVAALKAQRSYNAATVELPAPPPAPPCQPSLFDWQP